MPIVSPFNRAPLTLLGGVSRSFYLSIRLLPAPLRGPIAVGYLLARATDTVADTTALPQADRLQLLTALMAAIDSPKADLQDKRQALAEFAELQSNLEERALMQALPACLRLLQDLPPPIRPACAGCSATSREAKYWTFSASAKALQFWQLTQSWTNTPGSWPVAWASFGPSCVRGTCQALPRKAWMPCAWPGGPTAWACKG